MSKITTVDFQKMVGSCSEEHESYVLSNLAGFVKYCINEHSYGFSAFEFEDVYQECFISVTKALRELDYCEDKNGVLGYIRKNIKWTIGKWLRSQDNGFNYDLITEDEDRDVGSLASDSNDKTELRHDLQEAMQQALSGREKRLIELYYGWNGKPYDTTELPQFFDIGHTRVKQLRRRALDKLRNWLQNNGYSKEDVLKLSMEG